MKQQLRQRCEPICLFGEGPADRRNRLKDILSRLGEDALRKPSQDCFKSSTESSQQLYQQDKKKHEETWYHQGPESLKEARMFLVNYSIPRSKNQLRSEKIEKNLPEATRTARKQEMQSKLRQFSLQGSQNADSRPISYCSFSPNGKFLATSSWSGLCKLWEVPNCKNTLTLKGHNCYADCIEWHPNSTKKMEPSALNLASSGRDGSVYLWSLKDENPIGELPQLEARVSRLSFHPSGRFLGLCVHDNSWRLWDLQVQEEVLFQEGHVKPVYSMAFHNSGALCVTVGKDAYGRVWDLRTGQCVMFLSGHQNAILSVDWAPLGCQLVTGSEDNSVKVWDVRTRRCIYTIPAHTSIISGVRYDPNAGMFLVTCSFDGSVKLWSNGSYQAMKSLEGHGQKVMSADVSPDGSHIATCSFDRTFKLWGPD